MISCVENEEHFIPKVHYMTNFMLFFMFNSQTVMCIKINYMFAPENGIQSAGPMAKLTPINAFSAVKCCKNTKD